MVGFLHTQLPASTAEVGAPLSPSSPFQFLNRKLGSRRVRVTCKSRNSPPKSSLKWASSSPYGGCIPAILQALEATRDLDKALSPWEGILSSKERTIILKEQSDWERALQIFRWFKSKGCYELNVIHYNIMLRILGKAREWDRVGILWLEMQGEGVAPTNSTYGTLIDVFSKGGLSKEALVWLGDMFKQGLEPDEVTAGVVVQTYKKSGEFRKAEQFFRIWSSAGCDDLSSVQRSHSSYTFNTLIDTYGKAGQLKEASEVFAEMLKKGIMPNTVTFNTIIHICGNHGYLDEVATLMTKMAELRCNPDTRTYNILISLYLKNDDICKASSYFVEMKEAGLVPDVVSYRTLLYAHSIRKMVNEAEALVSEMESRDLEMDEFTQSSLTRMYIDAGMLEHSWSWFERFQHAMTSDCYAANIDAFGAHDDLQYAEKAFTQYLAGKKLNVLVFNVMIKVYGMGRKYYKACQVVDSMEGHSVYPDKCTYNSIIQILSGAELPEQAKVYVRKMQEAGLVNDCIPYCAVISSYVKLGELGKAEDLFKEMVGHRVQSDVVVFGIMINAFAEARNVQLAKKYVVLMENAGYVANSIICNSLIKLYTKVGYLQEAKQTYRHAQLLDDGPDMYSSNCMIELYCQYDMVSEGEEIFKCLKQNGDANEFSFAMMICLYKKAGRVHEAFAIAQEMLDTGLLSDVLSYNAVIELFALNGRLRKAVEIFQQMVNCGIKPNDTVFRSLGVSLIKRGASKKSVKHLELVRRRDAKRGIQAWIETVQSMLGLDENSSKIRSKNKGFSNCGTWSEYGAVAEQVVHP